MRILLIFLLFFSSFCISQCPSCSPGGSYEYSTNAVISSNTCYNSVSMTNNKLVTIQNGVTLTVCANWIGLNGDGITVNSGGTLIIIGSLILNNAFTLTVNGTVKIGSIEVGLNGDFNVLGGGQVEVLGDVVAGNNASISIDSGGSFIIDGNLTIGSGTITSDGVLSVNGVITGATPSGLGQLCNIPVPTSVSNGDFVWKGSHSNDFGNVLNWIEKNAGGYVNPTSLPQSTNNIIIPSSTGCSVKKYPNMLPDNIHVKNVVIESNASFTMDNESLTLTGNWINNGTFTSGNGTVIFEGSIAQTISGTAPTFAKLIVRNSSGVSLNVNTTVAGELSLEGGKLYTQGNTLSIGTFSTNGSLVGGSSTAYVVAYDNGGVIGKVKHFINSAASYVFPIGDATNYTPLTYTHNSGTLASASIEVYTKPVKVPGLNPSFNNYLNRFWEVTPTGITGAVNYNISYTCVAGDLIGIANSLYPVKISSGIFYKPAGTLFTTGASQGTGSYASNIFTWSGLTTYSSFGGAGNSAVSLPISLLSFTGRNVRFDNELKWVTASEKNNNYFTIEKSTDGTIFDILGVMNGAGSSNAILDYKFTDYNVSSTLNYYRLKQTDYDGVFKYTDLISIDNRSSKVEKQIAAVTNTLGQEVSENHRGLVIIFYTDGSSEKVIR